MKHYEGMFVLHNRELPEGETASHEEVVRTLVQRSNGTVAHTVPWANRKLAYSIKKATRGKVIAHVIRARPGKAPHGQWHRHDCRVQFVYVLKGWAVFEYEGVGRVRMKAGTCFYQPPNIRHREIRHSTDLEMIEVVAPANFKTREAAAPAARKSRVRRSRATPAYARETDRSLLPRLATATAQRIEDTAARPVRAGRRNRTPAGRSRCRLPRASPARLDVARR